MTSYASRSKIYQNNSQKQNSYSKDERYAEEKIIEKIQKKGFESLSIEELAMTIINPNFEENFLKKTGTEWSNENKSKAKERLSQAKFNIQWNTSMNEKSTSAMLKSPLGVLFDLTERGDLQKIIEYFKKNNQYLTEIQNLVDTNKKSLLHIASKCGHSDIIQFLISKNFSVYVRDKFLRTPLHLACQFGRLNCFNELLKGKSEILSKDSIGRNCLHYASCSNNPEIVKIILNKAPDLINDVDIYGRTPLHYAIWNGTNAQIDIIKLLIKGKANVNCVDEEKMTPLHFAADAGKGKVIKLLLENGANPFLKDSRTNRNCLEIACNEKIREIIVMYCGGEFKDEMDKFKQKGTNNLDNGNINNIIENDKNLNINDNKNEEIKVEEEKNIDNNNIQKGKQLRTNQNKQIEEEFEQDPKLLSLIQNQNKGKLVNFMGDIQDYGVQTMQHLTKPELYSGSWLERIHNMDDLYKFLSKLSPQESAIAIYNVLSPYTKQLPKGNGDEPNMAFFFNKEKKSLKNNFLYTSQNNLQMSIEGRQNLNNNIVSSGNNFNTFENDGVQTGENEYFIEQKKEINDLREQLKSLNKKFEDEKNAKESEEVLKLKVELNEYQNQNQMLKDKNSNLTDQIKNLTENIKIFENKAFQLQQNESIQKDKLINELTAQLSELNNEIEEIKVENKRGIPNYNNNISNNFQAINPKLYPALSDKENISLEEESNIYSFNKLCEKNGGLYNALSLYDQDNDMHLLKNDFNSVLDYLQIPFDIRDTIIKISGFENNMKLPINKIYNAFNQRSENKVKKLNECLYNIIYKLSENNKTVEELYKDLSCRCSNDKLSYQDFMDIACKKFYINKNDAKGIFENWDYKDNETKNNNNPLIDINILTKLLNERKNIIDQISNLTQKIKFNLNKTNKNQKNVKKEQLKINENEEEDNGEDTFKSDKRYSNLSYKNIHDEEMIGKNTIKMKQQIDEEEENYDHYNFDNQEEIEEKKSELYDEISNESKNSKTKTLNRKVTVSSSIAEITNIGEKVGDFSKSYLKKTNEMNMLNNDDYISENSSNKSIKNNKDMQRSISHNEENENLMKSSIIQKPQVSSSSKMKFFNNNDIINGELKIQVKNAQNIILPKSINSPYSFFLKFSLQGIDKISNSKDIISDDLYDVSFNWATRCLLKKKTLNDISSNCTISLFLKNNNDIIELGQCSFDWTCCLSKNFIDKYAIDDNFQILNNDNIHIGNIKIQGKFIPFGSNNSNYDKKGKRKKNPTNLNGLVKEESSISSINSSKKSFQKLPSIQNSQFSEKENNFNNNGNNDDNENLNSINNQNDENEEENNEINDELNEQFKQSEKSEKNEEFKQSEKSEINDNEIKEKEKSEINEEINDEVNEDFKQTEKSEKNDEIKEKEKSEIDEINDEIKEKENSENENKNKEESKEINDDEMTILKEVDAEITNIVDKDKLKDKNLYFSVYSHNNEVYSSKEENKINDIIKNLPFTFKFNLYSSTNEEKMEISICFNNEDDDSIYSQTKIELDAKEKNLTVTDQFIFKGNDEIRVFMKFTVNTIEDI